MKVLGISGSPRHGSNTEILLEQVLKGAESQGATTGILRACNLNIMPCSHCDDCLHSGRCSFLDDMQDVFTEIEQADCIVLAAPLQFMGVPAQMKVLIDRAQPKWCTKYILKQRPLGDEHKRHGLFVSVGGRTGEHLFEAAETTVKAFFVSLDIKYVGKVVFAGIERRAQMQDNKLALQEAFDAGHKLARSSLAASLAI
ncbi:MAG: flavodoxin family protein [Dehalococcoidia bacterium]|nr:flavodoxin family protein [Dehalococcoidia bacterium]